MTEWRAIRDWPEYEVSDDGQVRRALPSGGNAGKVGKVLKPALNTYGYYFVMLRQGSRKKTGLISRLVCEAWHGAPPTPQHEAAHGNGVRADNRPNNLRWATCAENQADKVRHGTVLKGEKSKTSKLTEAQALEIRRRAGEPYPALAKEFGVTPENISMIQRGKAWRHLGGDVTPVKRHGLCKLTIEQERAIAATAETLPRFPSGRLKNGELAQLARSHGLDVWATMKIIRRARSENGNA